MSEYKVQLKVTTQQEYLDGKKIPRVGNTVLETVSAANSTEAANKAKKQYKGSNHYKNIMKNQDSTQSPKPPRVSVKAVYGGGGSSSSEQFLGDPTDMSENLDSNKGMKKGGFVKRYKGGLMVAPKRAKRGY